jgi:hypothetical protein
VHPIQKNLQLISTGPGCAVRGTACYRVARLDFSLPFHAYCTGHFLGEHQNHLFFLLSDNYNSDRDTLTCILLGSANSVPLVDCIITRLYDVDIPSIEAGSISH